jgi:hypothetical protein
MLQSLVSTFRNLINKYGCLLVGLALSGIAAIFLVLLFLVILPAIGVNVPKSTATPYPQIIVSPEALTAEALSLTEKALKTSTPVPTATNTPYASPEVMTQDALTPEDTTPEPNVINFPVTASSGPSDDYGNSVDDPRVNITGVNAGTNYVEVNLEEAGGEIDYSFAILIYILANGNIYESYIWEMHNGSAFIGLRNPNDGNIVEGTEENITVEPQSDGTSMVRIINLIWPDVAQIEIMVECFHMLNSSSSRSMHTFSTGPFTPLIEDE